MHPNLKNKLQEKKPILIAITIGIVILFFFYKDHTQKTLNSPSSNTSLANYAEIVLAKCASDKFKPNCYDKEIPKLMDYITMEEAFDVTRIIQKKDGNYLYCHVLAHNISRRETQKDPSKWMDVIARCPATMCNNGCPHGAMMDRYKSESLTKKQIKELIPDMKILCEPRGKWSPTPIEISMCYHSIGHLAMYITGADLNQSADLCVVIGVKESGRNYVQTCTQGVFMQVFQPLEPEDFALIGKMAPTKDKVETFCEPFKKDHIKWEACRTESWPLFRSELMNPKYLENWCSFSDRKGAYKTCQANMMSIITVRLAVETKDLTKLDEFCMGLYSDEHKEDCYAYATGRLIQIDPSYVKKGLEVCGLAKNKGLDYECNKVMTSYGQMTYHKETKELTEYCAKMPKEWRNFCLDNSTKLPLKNE